jgi:glucokinase
LPREAIVTLNKGSEVLTANGALLAAGTGLGKAILLRTEAGWQPLPSEGGHSDFAPASELQIELLRYMRRRHGGCDLERVLSGPGLVHVYEFLHETNRINAPREFAERFKGEDGARVISEAALAESPEIAVAALNLFVDIYAAAASNFAVECLATGGVWLGGGIAPKILPFLQRPEFMKAYMQRDRMLDVIEAIPVRVILDPRAALLGAAHHGAQLL